MRANNCKPVHYHSNEGNITYLEFCGALGLACAVGGNQQCVMTLPWCLPFALSLSCVTEFIKEAHGPLVEALFQLLGVL